MKSLVIAKPSWQALWAGALLWLLATGAVFAEAPLYRLHHPGGQTSYLLGTMHSDDPRVMAAMERISPLLDQVDEVVLEMVPDGTALLLAVGSMLLADDQSLDQLLDESLYRQVVALAADKGLPEPAVKRLRPWALAVMLSMPKLNSGEFLDMRIHRVALEKGRKVSGLETAAEQLAVFTELDLQLQIRLLADGVEQADQIPQLMESMIQAYVEGDLARLQELTREQEVGMDGRIADWFDDAVIASRNQRMDERLLQHLNGKRVLVAVGALHLPGDEGLLQRLRDKGFGVQLLQ